MLIEPTQKYRDEIFLSHHYLNCPKFMFNYQIRCIIKHNPDNMVRKVVEDIFKFYKLSLKLVDDCIKFHRNTSEKVFDEMNVNPYIDNPPQHIITRSEYIEKWTKSNTYYEYGLPMVPSFPFKYWR
jgi:hypothetical protein